MSAFGDMMIENLPAAVPLQGRDLEPSNGNGGGGRLEVRTMNGNMGAVRVAVPRQHQTVNRRIQELASMAGDDWTYSLPFRKRDKRSGQVTVQHVEGPTVKCALDIARAYGNCVVDVARVEDHGSAWIFYGRFVDIETGFMVERPFRQRKEQNIGGMGGDQGRAEDIVFQIGASKAMRNAVVNALPSLIDRGRKLARNSIRSWIEQNRPKAIQRIREMLGDTGIPGERVERHFAQKLDNLTVPEIAMVVAQLKAVEEGYARPEEVFPDAEEMDEAEPERPRERQRPLPEPQGGPLGGEEDSREPGAPPAEESVQGQPEAPDGAPAGDEEVAEAEADPEDIIAAEAVIAGLTEIKGAGALEAERTNNRQLMERLRYAGHPVAAELDNAFRRREDELIKGRRR